MANRILRLTILAALVVALAPSPASADGRSEERAKGARQEQRQAATCAKHTDSIRCGLEAFCREHPNASRCHSRPAPVARIPWRKS